MGIREKLNQHSGKAMGAASLTILIGIALTIIQTRGGGAAPAAGGVGGKLFFTTDDGKTWFTDDCKLIPPFTRDGKEAVRAYVYRAGDGTEFVGLLERYSPAGKKALDAAMSRPAEEISMEDPFLAVAGELQWKKPGQKTWIGASDPRVDAVMKVVSPKGSGEATPVPPPQ